MKTEALLIRGPGESSQLELGVTELRELGHGEVLITVRAAGVNRADLLQRRGLYPAPIGFPQDVPGLEYSGEIARVGSGVTKVIEGSRVMGIIGGGAMARQVIASERELLPIPEGLSFSEAAAIPEAFLTAYDALIRQAGLSSGQRVLIHAVASGVGTAAVQIARLVGALPYGTTRSPDKVSRLKAALAFDEVIVSEDGLFADAVTALAGGPVSTILDTVGASYVEENLRCLASEGRWVLLGLLGGAKATMPLQKILTGRVHLIGSVLRSRPLEQRCALAQSAITALIAHFSTGALRPFVDRVFPMSAANEAHELLASNTTLGKIVLEWN